MTRASQEITTIEEPTSAFENMILIFAFDQIIFMNFCCCSVVFIHCQSSILIPYSPHLHHIVKIISYPPRKI